MISTKAKVEIPKGYDFSKVEDELQKGLQETARDHRAGMESFVINWEHKPKITQEEEKSSNRYSIFLLPTGDNKKFWIFVSRGAEGRTITPKRARHLVFRYQGAGQSYVPKTTPGGGFGGAGKKLGPVKKFNRVNWPGIEPRHFEEETIKANKKGFDESIDKALERGLKKAGG